MTTTSSICDNIARIREQIQHYGNGRAVELMLAAKHQPLPHLVAAYQGGGMLMGHNLIDQLATATAGLRAQGLTPVTAVIGHVQSNKLSTAMQWADRIDTVDSLTTAQRINRRQEQRIASGQATGAYPVLLQLNSAQSPTQYGCSPDEFLNLAYVVSELEYVRIAGVMTIGARGSEADIRSSFVRTRHMAEAMRKIPGLDNADVISMGMSGDMRIAIEEGASVIRVGTAVFGPRTGL
ncbi:YggS family pyridoxal phosphate-dependent enzyme [Arcanobacterium pinnipediorum]|uniref:YggS family pyridoxal phosphate-dependent enzyme n=1 Tax=Arcanobacterium pinnipediorum TaxID=1503041 RepID=A0ABY5AJ62_9ACTO|nr:YggS family pyridoxal phosphate-dependent enzyme [Arcanobacterium pinnipediorum]USR79796.1 YggS family pyridoxal phosphate-dependent enzyme [Arcanobacterium pinnipediorum]